MQIDGIQMMAFGQFRRQQAMSFLDELYPAGSDTGDEMLCHEGEESGIVITGTLELTVGSEIYRLQPGDGYYFDSNRPHRFRNSDNDVDCRLISCTTPANF